jgi:hypothetical protein
LERGLEGRDEELKLVEGYTGEIQELVWLKISAASNPLKLLRLGVYWTARSRHGFHPEEQL